jgi:hypothetical protein
MGRSKSSSHHRHHCDKKRDRLVGTYLVKFNNQGVPKSVAFYTLHSDGTVYGIDSSEDGPGLFTPFTSNNGVWSYDCKRKCIKLSVFTFNLPLLDICHSDSSDCVTACPETRDQNCTRVDLSIDAKTLYGCYKGYSLGITSAPCDGQDDANLLSNIDPILDPVPAGSFQFSGPTQFIKVNGPLGQCDLSSL